jgi:pilus assembly protein CpaE
MRRPTILVGVASDQRNEICAELEKAGFPVAIVTNVNDLDGTLRGTPGIGAAILDAHSDLETALAQADLLDGRDPRLPTIMIAGDNQLERIAARPDGDGFEYVLPPYSADSIRWRIEAMCIRSQTADEAATADEAVFSGGDFQMSFGSNAPIVAVFSPKGGVGKTTVATNLAAAVQVRLKKQVLLVDADTVTGHVITSLALEGVRTLNDAWRDVPEGGVPDSFLEVATNHASGLKVLALTLSPLHTEMLDTEKVMASLEAARRGVDLVVVDLHPSYHPLNLAIFAAANQILVPVTPDLPAIRAAVQFTDVAGELDVRDRLAMVINRANSGVPTADIERTVGMDSLALVRSGGLLFVKAANVGRTVIDMFPREKITEDFVALAERVLKGAKTHAEAGAQAQSGQGLRGALGSIFAKRAADAPIVRPASQG